MSERTGVTHHAFFWPGHGPMLALPALGSDWASSNSFAFHVDSAGTASGLSDLGATVWTCIQRLAFEPKPCSAPTNPSPRPKATKPQLFKDKTGFQLGSASIPR
jgi:hypothetical protein